MYFLQILAASCRIHVIREHLSGNASGFSYTRRQYFLAVNSQLMYSEKIRKNFVAHNNDKKIRAWSQSSK